MVEEWVISTILGILSFDNNNDGKIIIKRVKKWFLNERSWNFLFHQIVLTIPFPHRGSFVFVIFVSEYLKWSESPKNQTCSHVRTWACDTFHELLVSCLALNFSWVCNFYLLSYLLKDNGSQSFRLVLIDFQLIWINQFSEL